MSDAPAKDAPAAQQAAWTPTILASAREATLAGGAWSLEIRERPDRELGKALTALAERSAGGAIFFEPPFLNASWHRFGGAPKRLMALFDEAGETPEPRLAFPFSEAHVGLPPVKVWKAFSHPFAPLSLPLMERTAVEENCERFASLLRRLEPEAPLVFEDFPHAEAEAQAFVAALKEAGFATALTGDKERAALRPGAADPAQWLGGKRQRELRRGLRKLEELGEVGFEIATDFWDVLVRYEEFLLLETRSWKGRKGTSIHIVRKTAAFARQAVGALARQGRVAMLSLRLDGRAIAALVVLRSGNRIYPWKTAFDEAYRGHAPGTQLMVRATQHFLATPGFEFADSLATPGGWMDRLWKHRLALGTLVVAADPRRARSVASAIGRYGDLKARARKALRR